MSFSAQYPAGILLKPLPAPDANDTYDWTAVQAARAGLGPSRGPAKLLTATAGQTLPTTITFSLPDEGGALMKVSVTASPKWFTFVSSGVDANSNYTATLGAIATPAVKMPAGRVALVTTKFGTAQGMPGQPQTTEYFYQITPQTGAGSS